VLLAEDDAVTRLDLRRIVEEAGYHVCAETANGNEAVTRAREERPDLVVLDVGMPGLDGVEAARKIVAERPTPVVLLTGYGYGELVAKAIDVGVRAFVAKPFLETELLEALQAAFAQRPTELGLAYLQIGRG
jgi:response regulator NasT